MAQRLARKLCPRCKEKYTPDSGLLAELGLDVSAHYAFYKPSGCKYCNNIGYKGRTGIYEVMPMSAEIHGPSIEQGPPSRSV